MMSNAVTKVIIEADPMTAVAITKGAMLRIQTMTAVAKSAPMTTTLIAMAVGALCPATVITTTDTLGTMVAVTTVDGMLSTKRETARAALLRLAAESDLTEIRVGVTTGAGMQNTRTAIAVDALRLHLISMATPIHSMAWCEVQEWAAAMKVVTHAVDTDQSVAMVGVTSPTTTEIMASGAKNS
jgi:hypothetical protein